MEKTKNIPPASQQQGVYSRQSQDREGLGGDGVVIVSVVAFGCGVSKGVLKEGVFCFAVEFRYQQSFSRIDDSPFRHRNIAVILVPDCEMVKFGQLNSVYANDTNVPTDI